MRAPGSRGRRPPAPRRRPRPNRAPRSSPRAATPPAGSAGKAPLRRPCRAGHRRGRGRPGPSPSAAHRAAADVGGQEVRGALEPRGSSQGSWASSTRRAHAIPRTRSQYFRELTRRVSRITGHSTATSLSWAGWFSATVWRDAPYDRGYPRPHARGGERKSAARARLGPDLWRAGGPRPHADGPGAFALADALRRSGRGAPAAAARRGGAPAPEA